MLVSIVIPAYNRKDLLKECIKSAKGQSYSNIEIIIVDDGSEQDLKSVVHSFDDDRIMYLQHERNRGASVARNTGIKHANGDYIAFLDSDDLWRSDKIEKQIRKFDECSESVGVVYCDYLNTYGTSTNLLVMPHDLRRGYILEDLLSGWMNILTSQILVKKKCFGEVGYFNPDLPSFQEYDLLVRLSKSYQVDYVDERLVVKKSGDFEQIGDDYEARSKGLSMFLENHSEDIKKLLGEDYVRQFHNSRCSYIHRSKICHHFAQRKILKGMIEIMGRKQKSMHLSIEDAIPISLSLLFGEKGIDQSMRLKFAYNCHKHGFISTDDFDRV